MIHPTAIVESGARVADDVEIGPFCYVGPAVTLGPGTVLHNSVTIVGRTSVGMGNVFHPYCVIGSDPQDLKFHGEDSETVIGNHNVFRENCTVNKGTELGGGRTLIGNHNMLMGCSHVAHDSVIQDRCILANACLLAGHVKVENWAIISGQVCVAHFVTIGQHSFIGGGSSVNQDAPPYMISQGTHANVLGTNSIGLKRRGFALEVINALRKCHRVFWRSGAPRSEALVKIETEWGRILEVRTLADFLRASEAGRFGRAREAPALPGAE